MTNRIGALALLLVGCGHHDAPVQRRLPEDAPRTAPLQPGVPMDAPQPLRIQNIEPGDPPASMVVVTSHPTFYIDRTEVTIGAYRECVVANVCRPPLGSKWKSWDAKRPVTLVKPGDAWDYCDYRGKRLPTLGEWLRAALGDDGRKFPWGNAAPSCKFAVLSECTPIVPNVGRDVANVGSRPRGASPYGALDMAGNVREFVNSTGQRERIDAVTMGGDYAATPDNLGDYLQKYTGDDANSDGDEVTGFRCVLTPKR